MRCSLPCAERGTASGVTASQHGCHRDVLREVTGTLVAVRTAGYSPALEGSELCGRGEAGRKRSCL